MDLLRQLHAAYATDPDRKRVNRGGTGLVTTAIGTGSTETAEHRQWFEQTFGLVEIQPKIRHSQIPEDAPLRRYIDLPKLLDLLVNRRLLLPRLAELRKGDPWECSAKRDYAGMNRDQLERHLIDLTELAPSLVPQSQLIPNWRMPIIAEGSIAERFKRMSLAEIKQATWYLEYSRLMQDVVCSCWWGSHMDSDAMWRLYCDRVGVALTTSVSRLKSSVKCQVPRILSADFALVLENIQYKDLEVCDPLEPWLIKRSAFAHENEVRLYADYPLVVGPGFPLEIDLNRFIERIEVTPYAAKWQARAVEQTVERLLESSSVGLRRRRSAVVKQSKHLDAPELTWPEDPLLVTFNTLLRNRSNAG